MLLSAAKTIPPCGLIDTLPLELAKADETEYVLARNFQCLFPDSNDAFEFASSIVATSRGTSPRR